MTSSDDLSGAIHHFTLTGYDAGTPYCGVDRVSAAERGETFSHVPYVVSADNLSPEFRERLCPQCRALAFDTEQESSESVSTRDDRPIGSAERRAELEDNARAHRSHEHDADWAVAAASSEDSSRDSETFYVVENTPGYLPDADEPADFDSYADACAYANELADELEEDGGFTCDRSWASSTNHYAIYCEETSGFARLGRYIEVVRAETEA